VGAGHVNTCKHHQNQCWACLFTVGCFWAHLAEVSGGENLYSGSRIIIIIYPARSLAIGGRDGVDGGGGHWMTRSNYRTRHQSWLSGASSLLGSFGRGFRWGKHVFMVYHNYKNLFRPFCNHWGAGWGGWRRGTLDDTKWMTHAIYSTRHPSSLRPRCW